MKRLLVGGLLLAMAACDTRPSPVELESVGSGVAQQTATVEPQVVASTEVVAGPWDAVHSTGKPERHEFPFTVRHLEAYESLTLVVENLPNAAGVRVSSASVSVNGREVFGPRSFSQQAGRLTAPVALASSGLVTVDLQSAPGSSLRVSLVGQFRPGFGRITTDGGAIEAPDGGFRLTVDGGQGETSMVVQVFLSDGQIDADFSEGPTYGIRVLEDSGPAPVDGAPAPVAANQAPRLIRAQIQLTPSLFSAAESYWIYHTASAVTNVVRFVADATTDVAAASVTAHIRIVLGLRDAGVQFVRLGRAWTSECRDTYELSAPVQPFSGPHTVIYVHGWQLTRPNCAFWSTFDASQEGVGVLDHLNGDPRGIAELISFRQYTYPTFNPVDWAAQDLATELMGTFTTDAPVTIVAHSMGGLVARAAIEKYGAGPWVAQLITLGTPNDGSPLADPSYVAEAVSEHITRSPSLYAAIMALGGIVLETPGGRDLRSLDRIPPEQRPSSLIGSLGRATPAAAARYHFLGGEVTAEDALSPCTHGRVSCDFLRIGRLILEQDGFSSSDGIVPTPSAFGDGGLGSVSAIQRHRGLSSTHDHLELPHGDAIADGTSAFPDVILTKVADLIYEMARPVEPALGTGFGPEQFSLIPAGTFQMGATNGDADELPVHAVTITKAFYVQKTEVTQGQWRAVMGTNPSYFNSCGDTCPVEMVSWNDIQAFLTKLNQANPGMNFRLPTEAEWEYAARAGTTGDYGGNGVLEDMGWYVSNAGSKTHRVAQRRPNAWGLYDMHGNVFEWVNDWRGAYPSGAVSDPTGPSTGSNRMMRGGSWYHNASYHRSASREGSYPSDRGYAHGFRLARTQGLVFSDGFSGDLSNWWNPTGEGSWTIEGGRLVGDYGIGCGSIGCPHADLLLNSVHMPPSGNWRAEVETILGEHYCCSNGGAIGNTGTFSVWAGPNEKDAFGTGFSWYGGSPVPITSNEVYWAHGTYYPWTQAPGGYGVRDVGPWDPHQPQTIALEKVGSVYTLKWNGITLYAVTRAFSVTPSVGFSTYGRVTLDNFRLYALP